MFMNSGEEEEEEVMAKAHTKACLFCMRNLLTPAQKH